MKNEFPKNMEKYWTVNHSLSGVIECRHCKHWGTLKVFFDVGVDVCILRPSKRNLLGFKRKSANTPACQNFEPAYRFFY